MILIVDDHDDTRRLMTRLLEMDGHLVASAAGGREALSMLRAKRPDVVILDVMMPDVDGMQVLQTMRADDALRDVPVLMYSADSRAERVQQALAAGAQEFVAKLQWGELAEQVRRYANH